MTAKEAALAKPKIRPLAKLQPLAQPVKEKTVHVVLAFHAHEPQWDLSAQLQRQQPDGRVSQALFPENRIRRRFHEGRNVYRDLLTFSSASGIPVSLDLSNDLAHQIRSLLPGTYEELQRAYRDQAVFPIYTCAHQAHAVLSTAEDLREELLWNEQLVHDMLGAPLPKRRVFFFTDCSVEPRFFDLLREADMSAICHPHLSPRRAAFQISDDRADQKYRPFLVADGLVALPRHFRVSGDIWRPVAQMYPQQVKYRGYLMGRRFVFDAEYRRKASLEGPIERSQAVDLYVRILREALEDAPDMGLVMYHQDLELMDFGDVALEILAAAWSRVKPWAQESGIKLLFSTPDDYLEIVSKGAVYSKVDVHGMGWVPDTKVVLRSDGHYPPLYAGAVNGLDPVPAIYRKHPFIYWEPGKYLVNSFDWLIRTFGIGRAADVHASLLSEEGYQLIRFPEEKRLQIALRLMRQADNWGPQALEAMNKRAYLYGLAISDGLLLLAEFYPGRLPRAVEKLDPRNLVGLARLPEGLLDPRIEALRQGLKRLRKERDAEVSEAGRELDLAQDFREKAFQDALNLQTLLARIGPDAKDLRQAWLDFLNEIRAYCRDMFLSLDHLQRTWRAAGHVDFLAECLYEFLYELYPPRFPGLLDEVDSGAPAVAEAAPGEARLLQFALAPGSPLEGRTVSTLALAPDTVIAMIRRGGKNIIPKPDTVLQTGDRISLATSLDGEPGLDDLLFPKT